eukprot:scaffold252757_cov18-Tisochrysis_lutea.AAC.2
MHNPAHPIIVLAWQTKHDPVVVIFLRPLSPAAPGAPGFRTFAWAAAVHCVNSAVSRDAAAARDGCHTQVRFLGLRLYQQLLTIRHDKAQ